MQYISTRGACLQVDFETALMQGLAPDGGLYVPSIWPKISPAIADGPYTKTAQSVLSLLAGRNFSHDIFEKAYASFTAPDITPLKQLDKNLAVLELFHGPTLAFKDVALQLLGRLFDTDKKITILGATSGDTGSAAMEGCRHSKNAEIFILYPNGKPSEVQRRQMTTLNAPNIHAVAIDGTFDDCQKIVKTLFADPALRLSAVNSINWVRIAAQIVYYVRVAYAYPEPVTFIVPTGNFGNVYAAYAAKQMGAPIKQLVIASNKNDILTRFFETGTMQTTAVENTLSPSMDIQISSNFERVFFDSLNRDSTALQKHMNDFKNNGSFTAPASSMEYLRAHFTAMRCNDEQTRAAITRTYNDFGYLIDPHTAVGLHAYSTVKEKPQGPVVALACAHPAKFPDAVEKATGIRPKLPAHLADLFEREEKIITLPNSPEAVKKLILASKKD